MKKKSLDKKLDILFDEMEEEDNLHAAFAKMLFRVVDRISCLNARLEKLEHEDEFHGTDHLK